MGAEIICPACGQETLLRREPVFEGLRKVGERRVCVGCGHVFAEGDVLAVKASARPAIFGDEDRPKPVRVFDAGDQERRNCRACGNYVVNPFTQWCSVHRREVAATDGCEQFERRPEDAGGGDDRG